MSNSTHTAGAVQPQPVQPQTAAAPGANQAQPVDDAAAARLTAIRIRGQHADLDGQEQAQ
ncbi:hypothetical protein [Herbaspirillum sp. YR522]|uniref:hypothetical protein n=1 Tax=Herbaspirillum sp. YR522 TaxID=1144342 RepID=UPI00026F5374|nr:hypothetical protein [Herbaspirillum sp. YR522]EJN08435.1 hypothetical protein PMI40_01296 [Herbaspirillum sp. YR522]